MDDLNCYDYSLPEALIATEPLHQRDQARLLLVERESGRLEHLHIRDLPDLLAPRDCLILNDTQVVPARLLGIRTATGGRWEGLFLGQQEGGAWRLIGQSRGRLKIGETITVLPAHGKGEHSDAELLLTLIDREESGGVWIVRPESEKPAFDLLNQFGTVPLPPYVGRKLANSDDWNRYQTTFARKPGAVAAPTAGLHFTPELLQECRQRGVESAYVTLHVGLGTFRPIAVEQLDRHRMHSEWCELPGETARMLAQTRAEEGRIVAVGTTSVRTLESAAQFGGLATPWHGETDLFIRPPYEFRQVDCLLTNFHLPRSSLMVLVSAFAGLECIQRAYACAIEKRYRFYSYGDAMLIR